MTMPRPIVGFGPDGEFLYGELRKPVERYLWAAGIGGAVIGAIVGFFIGLAI